MLSPTLENLFASILENHTGKKEQIEDMSSLSGGSINQALRIRTSSGNWFAKYNSASRYPGMFEKEARGLEILQKAGEVYVPGVIGVGEQDNQSMLVLEYVQGNVENNDFWENFGMSLARLHKHSNNTFGLDHHNYIGSLGQYNHPENRWIDFFINHRLEVQLQMARDGGTMDKGMVNKFHGLYKHLGDFFPVENPSLLHGDLWSGNYMTGNRGEACIMDPAVYYGHRLMDVGMSKLFGGFASAFYDAYQREYPLEKNWSQAVEIANLYPLLVHVNLFGGGYLSSVNSVIRRFA